MTNSVAGWRSSKPLSKAKLAPKKIMVTVSWSSVGLIHCCFLNPGETIISEKYALQINEIYWKLQYLQPAFRLIQVNQQNGPNSFPQQSSTSCSTTNTSKVEQIELQSFASSSIFTWPLNWLPLIQATQQLFAGKTLPQPAGGRKRFPNIWWIPKHRFLSYRNKQTFLIGKNVLIVMVPILINKDVLEPSYDLKFTI